MNIITIARWEDFDKELKRLQEQLRQASSPLLYRGQSNSSWSLTTTLERAGCKNMGIVEYCRLIDRVQPAVESFTSTNWGERYNLDLEETLRDYSGGERFPSPELYSYLVYLRHHGFPSPLLDWSASPYVAAFFAFREPIATPTVSIYVFCERPKRIKTFSNDEPGIRRIGPYVRTHPRHFRQQSDYTIARMFEGAWQFCCHEMVFQRGKTEQDLLWRIDIPSVERIKVLRYLDGYNLNAYSLFGSEDTLMETMWTREVVLQRNE